MCKSQLAFARYNRSLASTPLGKKLRFAGAVERHADADEVSEDDELSYEELKGDMMTIGWNGHEMTSLEVVDMEGNPTNDDGEFRIDDGACDAPEEVRSIRARFCDMAEREQNCFIREMKRHICRFIGANPYEWEPTDEFVLERIEDETPEDVIIEMAWADYLARPLPPEDNPSDKYVGPGLDEEDDLIRIGQGSRERGLPNIGRRDLPSWLERRDHRRGPRTMKSRRPKSHSVNWRSHCPKYGRQDERHQAPRIEAKAKRRLAAKEAVREAREREQSRTKLFSEAEIEELSRFYPYDSYDHDEYYFALECYDREYEWKMEAMARAFGYTIDDPCDIAGTRGYMPGDFERRGYYGHDRSALRDALCYDPYDYDPYDDYDADFIDDYDDPRYCFVDSAPPHHAVQSGESEFWDLMDRFAACDDIFEGYGESAEAVLDAMQFGQSNSKRRTYHLRELMEKRPHLV